MAALRRASSSPLRLLYYNTRSLYPCDRIPSCLPPELRSQLQVHEVKKTDSPHSLATLKPEAIFTDTFDDHFWEIFNAVHDSGLKWVHSVNTGVENACSPQYPLANSSVVLTNSKGAAGPSLGEFVLLSILHFIKDLPRLHSNQREKKWEKWYVKELPEVSVGIVGLGGIGKAVASLLSKVGCIVNTLDRYQGRDVEGIKHFLPEDELLETSDFVVLALPNTPQTVKYFNRSKLEKMTRKGVLVNVGRGTVVDEEALIAFLKEGRILGSALDVFAIEPLPRESELWHLPNVLLSPHTADNCNSFYETVFQGFAENLKSYILGRSLTNIVDKQKGY